VNEGDLAAEIRAQDRSGREKRPLPAHVESIGVIVQLKARSLVGDVKSIRSVKLDTTGKNAWPGKDFGIGTASLGEDNFRPGSQQTPESGVLRVVETLRRALPNAACTHAGFPDARTIGATGANGKIRWRFGPARV
jgi:hypothetical protein